MNPKRLPRPSTILMLAVLVLVLVSACLAAPGVMEPSFQRSFVCAKEGFHVDKDKPGRDGRVKRPRAETRVGWKAMLVVKIQDSGRWVVSGFVKEHNHELVPPDKVHCLRSHSHVSGASKSLIDTLQGAGIGPNGIMFALIRGCQFSPKPMTEFT